MKNLLLLFVCIASFGLNPARAQDKIMSVEETVKWAKERSLKDRPITDLPVKPNPAARESLHRILADPQQRTSWQSVVYGFRYVGEADDVPQLAKWIEGFRGQTFDPREIDTLLHAEYALGLMNRRGVAGARSLCEKMMSPDYWRDLDIRITGDYNPVKDIGGSAYYLAFYGVVANAYSLDPDFRMKVEKVVKGIDDPKVRKEFKRRTDDVLVDYDKHMADGLFAWERLRNQQAEARARLLAEKKPAAPSEGAYFRAFDDGAIGDVKLDKAVRDRILREAREAFAAIAADFDKNDREAVLRRMCDHQKPFVLQDVEGADRVAELMKNAEISVGLDLEKSLVKDVMSLQFIESAAEIRFCVFDYQNKAKIDAAKVAAEPEKNIDLMYVWIPLADSQGLREKHPLMLDRELYLTGRASKDNGVSLCMMWQAGHWYWIPFGQ